MTYAVKLVYGAQYVLLEYADRVTRDEQEAGRAEAVRCLTQKGWRKLLADARRIDPIVSLVQDFEFTEDHRSAHPAAVRIAVVHHASQSERFRFIEDVAVNRGMDLKVFTDSTLAINWLADK